MLTVTIRLDDVLVGAGSAAGAAGDVAAIGPDVRDAVRSTARHTIPPETAAISTAAAASCGSVRRVRSAKRAIGGRADVCERSATGRGCAPRSMRAAMPAHRSASEGAARRPPLRPRDDPFQIGEHRSAARAAAQVRFDCPLLVGRQLAVEKLR